MPTEKLYLRSGLDLGSGLSLCPTSATGRIATDWMPWFEFAGLDKTGTLRVEIDPRRTELTTPPAHD